MMDPRELHKYSAIFRQHLSTFRETSKAKDDDQVHESVYCLSEDIGIEAVDFDSVQREWYKIAHANGQKVPCSVDAMYFADGRTYAVEFKSGMNVAAENLVRKIYDTVIALIEKENYTLRCCREKVEYLVVASIKENVQDKVSRRVLTYQSKPWNGHAWDRWKLYNLENVIVRKTYVIPPEMFASFAKDKHWTS